VIENRSAPPGPIVPCLSYENVDQAIAWLCGAFGFTERLRTGPEPDGAIHHAQLAVGLGAIILTTEPRSAHVQRVFVPVADVDLHCERAKAFGAEILSPPANCAFGERQYSVADLARNRWTFSQSIADVPPGEWGAQASDLRNKLTLLPRPRLCYLEIPSSDVRQSADFYEKVFGWNIGRRDSDHPSFDDATGNISGMWVTGRTILREPGLMMSIWVDNLEESARQVVANGGEIVEAPHPDTPGGSSWIATFRDPSGNIARLYQEDHP
jgi:predicted enzyme related to lactoylglutathione lyase